MAQRIINAFSSQASSFLPNWGFYFTFLPEIFSCNTGVMCMAPELGNQGESALWLCCVCFQPADLPHIIVDLTVQTHL